MEKSQITEYLGTLLVAAISAESSGIDVTQHQLNEDGSFDFVAKYHHGPKTLTTKKAFIFDGIIESTSVYFYEWGLYLPCFLVLVTNREEIGSPSQEIHLYLFMNESLHPFKQVLLPDSVTAESILDFDVKTVDGPTIFFLEKTVCTIYICNYYDRRFKNFDFASPDVDLSLSKLYHLKAIATDEKNRTLCIVEAKSKTDTRTTSAIQISADGTVEKSDLSNRSALLQPPKEYWQIVTAFSYCKLAIDNDDEDLLQCGSNGEEVIVLATEMKQFLICKGSNNIRYIGIPFGDCCKIVKAEVPQYDTFFLLNSNSSQCCVISLRQNKIIKHWTEVFHAFVGDFCCAGHDQILVLFSNVTKQSKDINFLLTDFLCCQKGLESTTNAAKQSAEVSKSLQAVKKALNTNIQAVILETEEKQASYDKKNELIKETWCNLHRMALRMDSPGMRQSRDLVPLFHSEKSHFEELNKGPDEKIIESPFKILEQNQFIVFDKLVVSLKLLNNLNTNLKNIHLQILAKNHTSQSSVVSCLSERLGFKGIASDSEERSPRSVLPGEILMLTAKTEVPRLYQEQPFVASLTVTWEQENSRARFSCCVGNATLSLQSYANGLYFPKRMLSTANFEKIEIEVISSQFNLSGFSDQITDILKGLKCEVIAETRQYEPKPCNEDIRGQVYILVSRSGMMAEITIRARSTLDATQLYNIVKSELPSGCTVSLPFRKHKELLYNFASCLSEELSILKTILTYGASTANKHDVNTDMEVDAPFDMHENMYESQRAVQRIRSDFHRKRKLTEMLTGDRDCSKLEPEMYTKYSKSLQRTNCIAELLALVLNE